MSGLIDSPAGAAVPATRTLSDVLTGLAAGPGDWISLGSIVAALSDRSFAALLVLFSGPNLLPLPPGASTLFGLPLVIIAAQLLLGRPEVWLPRGVRDRAIDRDSFARIAARLEPPLRRLERVARPRCWPFPKVVADRLAGALALAMAVLLVLPIPFGNWLPALSIVLCGIGLSERDGLWFGAGMLAGAVSVSVVGGVLGTAAVLSASFLG